MKTVIGIDVGGSTTKIVGFRDNKLIEPIFVRAHDQLTSAYGAFGRFTAENSLDISDIDKIMVTGVGSTFLSAPIYKIPCFSQVEFPCIGKGGLYLSGLDKAIVVSMGTGTALVYAEKDKDSVYLGGTGVGGGTLVGLSKLLTGMSKVDNIIDAASSGDLKNIDLRVSDITKTDIHPDLAPDLTAANFGKVSELASKNDIALGIINMIFETVGMQAIFAARGYGIRDIVLTGNMAIIPQAHEIFSSLNTLFDVNFIIPPRAQFSTVIGSALIGAEEK
ncbi:MAG: type II pantothenate kinase [Clostridia bacterium]|nr:type II pantothenate kinase [Clostridia bacterium]